MRRELILDRIEESTAVLTDKSGRVLECDAALLPTDTREGDALYGTLDDAGNITALEARAVPDSEKNKRRLSSLFAKNPKNHKTEQ